MSAENPNNPAAVKFRKSLKRKRMIRDSWPLLIWLGLAFAAYYIYASGNTFSRMNGAVDWKIENVAPVRTGVLKEILVEEGQKVNSGDIIAKMETDTIESEIESEKAKAVLRYTDNDSNQEKWTLQLKKVEAEIIELNGELEAERLKESGLLKRIEQIRPAVENRDRPRSDLDRLTSQLATIRETIGRFPARLEALNSQKIFLQGLIKQTNQPFDPENTPQVIVLNQRLEKAKLHASHNGTIAKINRHVGEVVEPGEPIVEILMDTNKTIVAFLPEAEAKTVEVNQEVHITPVTSPTDVYKGKILTLAPTMTSRLDEGSQLRGRRIRGRDLRISIEEETPLLPGQGVIIHLTPPKKKIFPWLRADR